MQNRIKNVFCLGGGECDGYDLPMKKQDIHDMFAALHAANPNPKSDLEWTNPFTLLVAVVLSAQTTDKGVNKATPALFAAADTPEKMAALGADTIRDYIKTIGLNNAKSKNVQALSEKLVAEFDGQVPQTREELMSLPGVGRKTANVVLNVAFGQPTMAVDTHVFRVANRLDLAPGKTPEEVEAGLERVVPPEFGVVGHHLLLLHGRYTCTARSPKCGECVVAKWCKVEEKRA